MIKTTLFSISTALALVAAGQASTVVLAGGRTGPVVTDSAGATVAGGLVRIGTLTGAPASNSLSDIDAVFSEFATAATSAAGLLGSTSSNAAGGAFDGQQIYLWVFNAASMGSASQHGVFTPGDPNAPVAGAAWIYPVHTGTGSDNATVSLNALLNGGADLSVTPGIVIDSASGGKLALTPIPEPSGALLAGLAGLAIAFRRRR